MEVLRSNLYRVELANGHRLLAFISGKLRLGFVPVALADTVTVRVSPYDLSKGSIVVRA